MQVNASRRAVISLVLAGSILLVGSNRLTDVGTRSSVATPFANAFGVVVVKVRINDRGPFDFMLDTGSQAMVVAPQLAENLKLPVLAHVSRSGAGVGGDLATIQTRLSVVSLGDLTRRNVDAIELPLPESLADRIPHVVIQGMVGCDFFKDTALTIDYGSAKLIVSKSYLPSHGAITMQMRLAMGGTVPAVVTMFDGTPGTFLVDSGNSAWPTLTHAFAERAGIDARYPSGTPLSSEAAGNQPSPLREICLGRFNLGTTFHMSHVPAYVGEADYGVSRWPDLDGSIGYEILRRVRPTLDFSKDLVYFEPVNIAGALDYATTADCVPKA